MTKAHEAERTTIVGSFQPLLQAMSEGKRRRFMFAFDHLGLKDQTCKHSFDGI
jgi:hypothetical protein